MTESRLNQIRVVVAATAAALTAFLAPATAGAQSPGSAPSAGPVQPSVSPAIVLRAREWLRRRQTGDVDVSQLYMDVPMIVQALSVKVPELATLGDPTTFVFLGSNTNGLGFTNYAFRVGFANGSMVQYIFGLSPNGKVNKLGFNSIPGEPSPFASLAP